MTDCSVCVLIHYLRIRVISSLVLIMSVSNPQMNYTKIPHWFWNSISNWLTEKNTSFIVSLIINIVRFSLGRFRDYKSNDTNIVPLIFPYNYHVITTTLLIIQPLNITLTTNNYLHGSRQPWRLLRQKKSFWNFVSLFYFVIGIESVYG